MVAREFSHQSHLRVWYTDVTSQRASVVSLGQMPMENLESIVAAFQSMQAEWGPDVTPAQMRSDWDAFMASFDDDIGARVTVTSANGVPSEQVEATGASPDRNVLYFHGGGYAVGSPRSHRGLAKRISAQSAARILVPDYRLAPEHLFPAAVDDGLSAYRWLISEGIAADRIALAGDSAGGGLALAVLLALRDGGEALPACAVLLSPWADMKCSGESYQARASMDPIVSAEMCLGMAEMYVGEADHRHPHASPVYGNFEGLPPILVQVGEREIVVDDALAIERRAKEAGVPVQVDIWKHMIHQWQLYASVVEDGRRAIEEIGDFIRRHIEV